MNHHPPILYDQLETVILSVANTEYDFRFKTDDKYDLLLGFGFNWGANANTDLMNQTKLATDLQIERTTHYPKGLFMRFFACGNTCGNRYRFFHSPIDICTPKDISFSVICTASSIPADFELQMVLALTNRKVYDQWMKDRTIA